jgi:hypothetical protein
MPSGRLFPSAFGMYRRVTALGRYSPARNTTAISSRKRSTPYRSTSASDWASSPATPRRFFTRFHALQRTSLLHMRSYSAWNRRSGHCLAATHSRRRSSRTWSPGVPRAGELGLPAMPLRLPSSSTCPPLRPFPPTAFFVTVLFGTMTPSDFRCAVSAFAFGLCGAPSRDDGGADGSLVFRDPPCTRAALHTPPGAAPRSEPCDAAVAFTVT